MEINELTGKVIGICMEVHRELGSGFQEVIYQRALEYEFTMNLLNHKREFEMSVIYKGKTLGTRRVDFYLEDRIMLEIKAVASLEDVHLAQGKNYLEAYGIGDGLLINFGGKSLEFKRLYNYRF